MALVKCPECGSEVSSLAEACPRCAYPIARGSIARPCLIEPKPAHKTGRLTLPSGRREGHPLFVLLSIFAAAGVIYATCSVFWHLAGDAKPHRTPAPAGHRDAKAATGVQKAVPPFMMPQLAIPAAARVYQSILPLSPPPPEKKEPKSRDIVIADQADLLLMPSFRDEEYRVLSEVPKGTRLSVVEMADKRAGYGLISFFKVSYKGKDGWINENYTDGQITVTEQDGSIHVEQTPGGHGPRMLKELTYEQKSEDARLGAKRFQKKLDEIQKESGASLCSLVGLDGVTAKIAVANPWHRLVYQERLQLAQMIQRLWASSVPTVKPDEARIRLTDLMGNEVGGSRALGGTLIWVQK